MSVGTGVDKEKRRDRGQSYRISRRLRFGGCALREDPTGT